MIAVTGAAGFIGQHLVRYLLHKTREDILCVDNLRRGAWGELGQHTKDARLRLVQGDIRDFQLLRRELKGVRAVFHLAGQSNVLGAVADIGYSFESNVMGTFNVLRAAQEVKAECVVFTSSREVYGEPRTLPVKECSPIEPKNAYGASKAAAEAYCRVFDSPEMRVVTLRLSNVYGPGDRERVIPIFIERASRGTPLLLYGGEQVLDLVPVSIVVRALWNAAEKQPIQPVNVGSGIGTPLKDLANRILELAGSQSTWRVVPSRSMEVVRFVANVTRMRECLGIEPPADPLVELPELFCERESGLDPVRSGS